MYYTEICNQCQREIPIGYMYQDFGLCWDCGRGIKFEYERKQSKASTLVNQAIAAGQLIRPDTCELCSKAPGPSTDHPKEIWWRQINRTNRRIMAHHWRGYEGDAALDVWFICASCNAMLQGRKYHNGSVSKEEARVIVLKRRSQKEWARRWQQFKRARFALRDARLYPITPYDDMGN